MLDHDEDHRQPSYQNQFVFISFFKARMKWFAEALVTTVG
jgi:hypothetical protein